MPTTFERYIEPFSGSACLFFAVRPKRAIISDLNEELIQAYRTIRLHPLKVARALASLPSGVEKYYEIRRAPFRALSEVNQAARFVYLNRHCFNGVYRTNKKGEFNVPFGTRLGTIPNERHFNRCAYALRCAELLDGDFESVLERAAIGDFIYMDPPYAKANSRQRGEYGYASFASQDLSRLTLALDRVDKAGATFLLSYANCPEIEELRERWCSGEVLVRRQVSGFAKHREVVSELLISNRPIDTSVRAPK